MQYPSLLSIPLLLVFNIYPIFAEFNLGLKGGVGLNHSTGSHAKNLVAMGPLNISDLLINPELLHNDQMGSIRTNIGLLLGYNINRYVGIMSNLFWGLNNRRVIGNEDHNVAIGYHSIDVDLLIKAMLPLSFGRFYFAGGPIITWGVSKVTIIESSSNLKLKYGYSEGYTNPLWALAADFGFELDVKHGFILLILRSQWNITTMGPLIAVRQHIPLSFQTGYIVKFK